MIRLRQHRLRDAVHKGVRRRGDEQQHGERQ